MKRKTTAKCLPTIYPRSPPGLIIKNDNPNTNAEQTISNQDKESRRILEDARSVLPSKGIDRDDPSCACGRPPLSDRSTDSRWRGAGLRLDIAMASVGIIRRMNWTELGWIGPVFEDSRSKCRGFGRLVGPDEGGGREGFSYP